MFYSTCTNCAVDKGTCARRAEIRAAIKGTGITSAKFRCDDRQSIFNPGQRVAVTWPVGADYDDTNYESWPATIIAEVGTRFLISVDDVDGDFRAGR